MTLLVSLANFPTTDGRHIGLTVKGSGTSVTLPASARSVTVELKQAA
jgi:hypothetical protein